MIIASGETQVDAVTAAGLAGNLNAPVLLTRSNQLPHNVARFIDEHNVTDVVVVGGTAAVPDSIVTAIEGLGSRPDVERVSGADRYATAAAIGDRLGGPNPTWCGSTQTAAILVNGGDAGRADAIVAGPLAFRLGLPVLLTAADELPDSTSAFLTDNKVERVVVIGGATAVSAGVMNTLVEDVGVVNAQRISGGTAAGTSVAVAKEMLGNCSDVLSTNPDMVALVNRDATADGITAAPVLGRGLGDGGSVPILLVGDDLPAAVNDYLESTAEARPGYGKTHLRILAIGGRAVVSKAVMEDAEEAAETSADLTVEIEAQKDPATGKYTDQFEVTFSDDVHGDSVKDPTLYRVNGRRVEALADVDDQDVPTDGNEESITIEDFIFVANRTLTITLSHVLEAGDKISVVGGGKVGTKGPNSPDGDDGRKLQAMSVTLVAVSTPTDRTAPVVDILAVVDPDPQTLNNTFTVYLTEPNWLHDELTGTGDLRAFVKVDGKGTKAVIVQDAVRDLDVSRYGVDREYTVTTDVALGDGDQIIIERRAFLDKGGRGNALKRYTVKDPVAVGKFEITSVEIGDQVHSVQAGATILADDGSDKIAVTAKATGVAAGAPGNHWVIYGYDDHTDDKTFEIDVNVDVSNQVVSYTISDTTPPKDTTLVPTLLDLAKALNSNDDFASNFELDYVTPRLDGADSKGDPLGKPDEAGVHFSGGVTQVAVLIKFNDAVSQFVAGAGVDNPHLIDDPLWGPGPGASLVFFTGISDPQEAVTQLYATYMADDVRVLPQRSKFTVIPRGVVYNFVEADELADLGNNRKILNSLRPNSSIKPTAPGTPDFVAELELFRIAQDRIAQEG